MLYRLYDGIDIIIKEAHDVNDALETFGKEYDRQVEYFGTKEKPDAMKVKVFIDKGKGNKIKFAEYSILDFLHKEPVLADFQIKGKEVVNDRNDDFMEFRERAKNFDEAEQKEALLYMPTGFILGELARRLEEYDTATAGIAGIIDNMKIYHKE